MKKTFKIHLPEYITVDMYQKIQSFEGEDLSKNINLIATLIGIPYEEVKQYPIQLIKEVAQDLENLSLPKEQFSTLVEFNGVTYGYSDIHSMNLGCFIDLQEYCKDSSTNLHKIASILYRPITKNRFNSLEFVTKQGIKIGSQKGIENPFDYYEIEEYDSKLVKDRWEEMKDFPSHILLGGLAFFLSTASLYLTNIAYSENKLTERRKKRIDSMMMESLSHLTGGGGQPYSIYLNPVSYQSPEISL
jgi:hypothetical protein